MLEYWSQLNNVFDFVRVEDIAYDKRPGMGNVVYFVDSGRGHGARSASTRTGLSTNGRIWKMVLDPERPDEGRPRSPSVVEGDDNPVKTLGEIHQPDNIETTQTGLLVTEDPGASQQFRRRARRTPERDHGAAVVRPVLGHSRRSSRRSTSRPTAADRRRPAPTADPSLGNWGAWETSGIVDASAAFGPGAFLIDVQAHTLWVEKAPGTDNFIDPAGPDFTYKREGGQLLLIRIPGI